MTITQTDPRPRFRRPLGTSPSRTGTHRPIERRRKPRPIIVAVDGSPAAAAAVQAAVRLARDLTAPLVFVYVRRGPSSALGEPYYQRRLDAEMRAGRRALDDALASRRASGRARHRRAARGKSRPARRRVRPPARRAPGRARLAAPARSA